jgi:uroporphyrinogen decarboxylase
MKSERYERVMAAMNREVPDRVPWAVWAHAPAIRFLKYYSWEKAHRDGAELANAHVALLRELDYKMDLLKVTNFYSLMTIPWGAKYLWTDNEELPELKDVPVKKTEDWSKLWVLDPKKELKEHVRATSILSRKIGRTVPFIYSFANPLIQAAYGVSTPDRFFEDMKNNPDAIKEGLETIAQTCIDFGRAVVDEGASGIFYGIGWARPGYWDGFTRSQLEEYAVGYDEKVLNAIDAPIKMLHICSSEKSNPQVDGGLMEDGWFKKFPGNAINWWDYSHTPVSVAKKIYGDKFCIISGVDHKETMLSGTPQQIEAQVKAAIEGAGEGGGLIVAPGCCVHQATPLENFNALARAVKKYGEYRR